MYLDGGKVMNANKYAKIAIISASALLVLALIFDIAIFYKQLLATLVCGIIAVLVFMILLFAFVLSIVLVFGFNLLNKHGFWPFTIVLDLIENMYKGNKDLEYNHILFIVIKISIIILSLIIIIISIISMHHNKIECEGNKMKMMNKNKYMAGASIIISVVLIIVALSLFMITSI